MNFHNTQLLILECHTANDALNRELSCGGVCMGLQIETRSTLRFKLMRNFDWHSHSPTLKDLDVLDVVCYELVDAVLEIRT